MQSFKSFGEVNQALAEFVSPTWPKGKRYTLERMINLMNFLGNPQDKLKIIHVAGTSGKTSTSYYISSLLAQAGQKVGTSVSPHVDQVNERLQINVKPLAENIFCQELSDFMGLVEKSGIRPSYFELIVAFAYWEFAKQGVDYAVMEVGLGGLLDATNVINSQDKVCVITDIGLDHTKVLGNDVESIAFQKAGIITKHNAVFCLNQDIKVMNVIRETCSKQHAQLFDITFESVSGNSTMPLFQQRNWQLASEVFDYVRQRDELKELAKTGIRNAQNIHIPARMEQIELESGKVLILDGGHNPQKLHAFAEAVQQLYPDSKRAVLFSLISGKDALQAESVREMTRIASHIIFTSFRAEQDMPRPSADPHELVQSAKTQGFKNAEVVEAPEQAFEKLKKRPEKVLIVTGSFYLLNHVRPLIFKA